MIWICWMQNSEVSPSCCVVIPVGPGHADLAREARASVEQAVVYGKGAFQKIGLLFLDDADGKFGRSQRRNEGLSYARQNGFEWVFFLDADDLMAPEAFTRASGYMETHDAIWGAIWETFDGCTARLRAGQIMPFSDLRTLLSHDPVRTLQMGHFVRTEVAAKIGFDEEKDCGEDFQYYLKIWSRYRCIKIDQALFFNRRGFHSTGRRSADSQMWLAAVDRVMVDFLIAEAEQLPTDPQRRRIIVTGYSRSGSTMFYRMLASTVRAFSFFDHEARALDHLAGAPDRLVTKRPLDVFDLPRIQETWSDTAPDTAIDVIFLIRDPRSLLVSRHARVPNHYFMDHDLQYFIPTSGEPQLINPGLMPTHHAIQSFLSHGNPSFRKLVVRYEDLVRAPLSVQAVLGRSLGLTYHGHFSDFDRYAVPAALLPALNGVRPLDPTRLTPWRQPSHAARLRDQFTRCPALFEVLIAYGYEKDNAWFDELSDGA